MYFRTIRIPDGLDPMGYAFQDYIRRIPDCLDPMGYAFQDYIRRIPDCLDPMGYAFQDYCTYIRRIPDSLDPPSPPGTTIGISDTKAQTGIKTSMKCWCHTTACQHFL